MQDPFCPRCGFLQRGVFCSPSLGCYFPELEKVRALREKLERKRAFCSDFDPLDYDGTSGGKKAKGRMPLHAIRAPELHRPLASSDKSQWLFPLE